MSRPPGRLVWAVDRLTVRPGDRVLEIGCGRGVAAALMCERIGTGRYLGLDRSAKAIAAAEIHNADDVVAGRAAFRQIALEDVDPAELGRFDGVFAGNVNLFWTRPAQHELRLVADLLKPGGRLVLAFDPPTPDTLARLEGLLLERLDEAGFRSRTSATESATGAGMIFAVTARPIVP